MNVTKMTIICCAALAVVSCHNGPKGVFAATSSISPTAPLGAQIFPTTLPATRFVTRACPLVPAFTTAFDLVVVSSSGVDLFLDRVILRLTDGSVVGNPPITYPRPELSQMFGSTLIVGSRSFPFRPQFGCRSLVPIAMAADVVLVDGSGETRSVTISASFQ